MEYLWEEEWCVNLTELVDARWGMIEWCLAVERKCCNLEELVEGESDTTDWLLKGVEGSRWAVDEFIEGYTGIIGRFWEDEEEWKLLGEFDEE